MKNIIKSLIFNIKSIFNIKINMKKSEPELSNKRNINNLFSYFFIIHERKTLTKRMLFINLPESFSPDEHIIAYPPEQHGFVDPRNEGFMKIRMLYILWQIGESASYHERTWKETGFIAVSGKTFQKRVQSYKPYLDYLINTGVIEFDNHYIPQVIPYGYRFAERFHNEPFRRIDLIHGAINEIFNEEIELFPYLTYWYKQDKLKLNSGTARNEAYILYSTTIDNKRLWNRGKYGKLKNPYPQYYSAIQLISKIESNVYNLKISLKVHRLYSTLTAMPSKYRKYLKYDNQHLGCIDIKNCQSYIACLILKPEFWRSDSNLPLTLYSLPQNIIDLFDSNLIIMIGEYFSGLESPDIFNEYIDLVSNGGIYQDMILWAQQEKEKTITKERVKEVVFSTIFSPVNSRKTWLHGYYTQKFAPVIDFFNIIKHDIYSIQSTDNNEDIIELNEIEIDELAVKKPHARLSILFQAIESEIILHRCCKRIFEERIHSIPIFTVHDCIITTQNNMDYLENTIIEEFTTSIGYPPPIDIESW